MRTRRHRQHRQRSRKTGRRPVLETLECRELLAVVGDTPAPEPPHMECTLRAAIMETNAHAELNQILFNLASPVGAASAESVTVNSVADWPDSDPGDGVCSTGHELGSNEPATTMTIVPQTPLPPITDHLDLDGRRYDPQLGQVPGVAIDGAGNVPGNGLEVKASQTVVHGLSVQRFNKSGIAVFSPDVIVANNYLGTDLTGKLDRGNREHGVLVENAARVWIGASRDDVRGNVISGNDQNGVLVAGAESTENVIGRNIVGLTVDGDQALPNSGSGVVLTRGASRNQIGPPELCASDVNHPWICENIISGNERHGVQIDERGTSDNAVFGNRIGTNIDGSLAIGNQQHGVLIASGARTNEVRTNLISGNIKSGLVLEGAGTERNLAVANWIGVDSEGQVAIPNGAAGVWITADEFGGPVHNRIGSDGDGCDDSFERNIISGNRGDGVWITGEGTRENYISGNNIGLDSTETLGIGNRGYGVRIDGRAKANRVGIDDVPEAGDSMETNIIAANGKPGNAESAGVFISGAGTDENVISGNRIGTNLHGAAGLGNFGDGVRIANGAADNQVAAGASMDPQFFPGNVIAGQGSQRPDYEGEGYHGVRITGAGTDRNVVTGNHIGVDGTGLRPIPNIGDGVRIDGNASQNRIGSAATGTTDLSAGNQIAHNGGAGVRVIGQSKRNPIRVNRIHDNGELGIDLAGGNETGLHVTLNDANDADDGPNSLLNFPVLYHGADLGGTWLYEGLLGGRGIIDVYSNSELDPSEHGEGTKWETSIVPAGNVGDAFQLSLSRDIPGITTTTTDAGGNTSEFGVFVQLAVDLDADTDNTGAIDGTQQEEDDETTAPGMIVMMNRDDDNENDRPDYQDTGAFVNGDGAPVIDNDLVPLVIRELDFDELDLSGFKLRLKWSDDSRFRLWKDRQRSERIDVIDEIIGQHSRPEQTFYFEGIAEGATVATLELVSPLGTVVATDDLRVSVVNPNLTAFRPKTEDYGSPFQRWAVPESEEIEPGIGIRRNGDDDNKSRFGDRYEQDVIGENDLIEVDWSGRGLDGVAYEVRRNNDHIRVWEGEFKTELVLGDSTSNQERLSPTSDGELWVEWKDKGDGFSDLSLVVVDKRYNRVVERASEETLRFSPFNSLIVVLGGRGQQPQDPVQYPGQQGMFQTAIDLYREGYDVRMYNERKGADGDGNGLAYDAIKDAVNMRGVTHVAILGYSHGGGSTYDLSKALFENSTGARSDIVYDFSLDLTSYIDAIQDEDIGADLEWRTENRRPLNTGFHLNQYQRNGLLHGTLSFADRELDRTDLGVNHMTIDDHNAVLSEVKKEVRNRMKR